jgi:hypothetical protein
MSEPVIESTPKNKPVNTWWTYIINLCTANKTSSQIQVEEPLINESSNPVADILSEQIFEPDNNSDRKIDTEEKMEEQEQIEEPAEEQEQLENKEDDVIAGSKNEDEDEAVDMSNESIEPRESPDQYEETKEESI